MSGRNSPTRLNPFSAYLAPLLTNAAMLGLSYVSAGGTVNPGAICGRRRRARTLSISRTTPLPTISAGALVNQSGTNGGQDVTVESYATTAAVDLAGFNSVLGFGGAAGPTAVGGYFEKIGIANNATALIDDMPKVSAGRDITVQAGTSTDLTTAAVAGGAGGSIGVDGAVLYVTVADSAKAVIEDGANVQAGQDLNVIAQHAGTITTIAGGLAQAGVTGIGASGAITSITNTTIAAIDNINGNAGSNGVVQAGRNLTVHATSTQDVFGDAIAGAAAPGLKSGSGGATSTAGKNYGYGISGDVAINIVSDSTKALLGSIASASAAAALSVTSDDDSRLRASAGGVSFGATLGINGAFAWNKFSPDTEASTHDVSANAASFDIEAHATDRLAAVTDGGARRELGRRGRRLGQPR